MGDDAGPGFALTLGTVGGALEFVPLAGPLIAGTAMMAVAMLSGYPHWGFLLLFLFAWRMVQDYVISPRVMGVSVELHPLAALFGILAGGEIAGILGVYLSIPVMVEACASSGAVGASTLKNANSAH